MGETVYSASKALWQWDRMAALRRGEQPSPVHVELVISDWCNHNCAFCAYRMSGYTSNALFQVEEGQTRKARNPRRMIPVEKCREIIDDCVAMGVRALQLTGGGEPTVHPDFAEIANYALDAGLQVALVTNGSMLLDEAIRAAVRRMTWVRVSVDAARPETYCETRDVGMPMWHRVEDGTQLLCAEKREQGLDHLTVGVGFVVTPDNWREVAKATALYRSWGADNVRIGCMFSPKGIEPYRPIMIEAVEMARIAEVTYHEPGRFEVISRLHEKLMELEQGPPLYRDCWYQHFTTYIGADLNVYRCCVYAYHPRGIIGSLTGQRFSELWASDAKCHSLKGLDAQKCERCQFNAINEEIGAALQMEEAPPHVDFV